MLENRVWAWVHRGTASDRRTGFVEMSDAQARNAIAAGRAQDPLVGELHLKHIDPTVPAPLMAARRRNGSSSSTTTPASSAAPAAEPAATSESDASKA